MNHGLRTIVGGRSAAYRELGAFPRGMEIMLKKAKVDKTFRDLLLKDPAAAATGIDLALSASELKILSTTPQNLLKSMIDSTFVPKHHVGTFLRKSSAAMLAVLLGSSAVIPTYAGSQGERVEDQQVYNIDLAQARMASIQTALEQYRLDRGSYPSTETWLSEQNPLGEYVALANTQDPWKRKFHYEGVTDAAGKVVDYLLESLGRDPEDPGDNVPCPTDADRHSFPRPVD